MPGAIERIDASATAYSHRDKPLHATLIGGGMERGAADHSAASLQRAWTALEPRTAGAYVNFMGHHEAPERVRTASSRKPSVTSPRSNAPTTPAICCR
ncbi:MAG TPA: hypothetical protein VF201_15700 [Nitrolancea sp.]